VAWLDVAASGVQQVHALSGLDPTDHLYRLAHGT
jgi:hypothetical protein